MQEDEIATKMRSSQDDGMRDYLRITRNTGIFMLLASTTAEAIGWIPRVNVFVRNSHRLP